jgi:hypothetical protein
LSAPVYEALPVVCEQIVDTVLAWQQAAEAVPNFRSLEGFRANRGGAG